MKLPENNPSATTHNIMFEKANVKLSHVIQTGGWVTTITVPLVGHIGCVTALVITPIHQSCSVSVSSWKLNQSPFQQEKGLLVWATHMVCIDYFYCSPKFIQNFKDFLKSYYNLLNVFFVWLASKTMRDIATKFSLVSNGTKEDVFSILVLKNSKTFQFWTKGLISNVTWYTQSKDQI